MGWLFNGKGKNHNPRRCRKAKCKEQRCQDYWGGYQDGNAAGFDAGRAEGYQAGLSDGAAMAR